MKDLYDLHKAGWWIKVSPLARKEPECWMCAIYKKGKFSWITEECKDFNDPKTAYEWGFTFVDNKTRGELYE